MYVKDNVIKGDKIDQYLYLLQKVKTNFFLSKKDNIKIFIDQRYSKAPMRSNPTIKIIYNHIDEIWTIDLADKVDYKISNNKRLRYLIVIVDKFSKYLWAVP